MSLIPQPTSFGTADPSAGQGSAFQTPESSATPGVSLFATPFTRVLQGWQGRQMPALDASLRHGSALPGSAQRTRTPRGRGRGETRPRGNSGISPVSTTGLRDGYSPRRDEPSGPEEANHWGTALVQVAEAIQTIERNQRLHATEIAIGASRISEL